MAYAALRNLLALQPREVLLQLADDDGDGEFRANPRNAAYRNVMAAAADASSLIDLYISARYGLPLAKPYPELIVQIASHLALCMLYDRKRELDMPEGIKDRRERYMALLREIRDGGMSTPEMDNNTAAAARVISAPREFSRELLAGM